jgi:flagellar basal body-associated protein FliL
MKELITVIVTFIGLHVAVIIFAILVNDNRELDKWTSTVCDTHTFIYPNTESFINGDYFTVTVLLYNTTRQVELIYPPTLLPRLAPKKSSSVNSYVSSIRDQIIRCSYSEEHNKVYTGNANSVTWIILLVVSVLLVALGYGAILWMCCDHRREQPTTTETIM